MANGVDPDQTSPRAVWSGSALFAYVILSETLVFEILGYLRIYLQSSAFTMRYSFVSFYNKCINA